MRFSSVLTPKRHQPRVEVIPKHLFPAVGTSWVKQGHMTRRVRDVQGDVITFQVGGTNFHVTIDNWIRWRMSEPQARVALHSRGWEGREVEEGDGA